MNGKKWLTAAVLAALLGFEAGAETIRFRSGQVLAAELTKEKIPVAGVNPDAFPAPPGQPIYAVLSVRIDPARRISIFDYSLNAFGCAFPCVAISRSGKFEYFDGDFGGGGAQNCQLLFILDGQQTGMKSPEIITLQCNLPPKGVYDCSIPFSVKKPTPFSSLSAAGTLELGEKK